MNKYLLFSALALSMALSGCGQTAAESPTVRPTAVVTAVPSSPVDTPAQEELSTPPLPAAESPLPAPVPTPEPTPEPTPAPTPESLPPEPDRPSDEAVLAAYREAAEVYSWFAGYHDESLLLDREDILTRPLGEEEIALYRVTRLGLGSLDELRGYLKDRFSDEIVDVLMNPDTIPFAEGPEGGLYALPAGRGSDITKGGVTLEVQWPMEGEPVRCTVLARVELLSANEEGVLVSAGEESHQFPYEKVGEKWVFTQFESLF